MHPWPMAPLPFVRVPMAHGLPMPQGFVGGPQAMAGQPHTQPFGDIRSSLQQLRARCSAVMPAQHMQTHAARAPAVNAMAGSPHGAQHLARPISAKMNRGPVLQLQHSGQGAGPGPGPGMAKLSKPITLYVGHLTSKVKDEFFKTLLGHCGPLRSWKRVTSNFGFVEFHSQDGALRCMRILADRALFGKKVLINADKKTKEILNQYEKDIKEGRIHLQHNRYNFSCEITQQPDAQGKSSEEIQKDQDNIAVGLIQTLIQMLHAEWGYSPNEAKDNNYAISDQSPGSNNGSSKSRSRSKSPNANARASTTQQPGSLVMHPERSERSKRKRSPASDDGGPAHTARNNKHGSNKRSRSRSKSRSRSRRRERREKRNKRRSERKRKRRTASPSSSEAEHAPKKKKKLSSDPEKAPEPGSEDAPGTAKELVSLIPKDQSKLLRYPINWELIDKHELVEKTMRGWIDARIKEYLGEEEADLTNFAVGLLAHHIPPKDIISEMEMVLVEDAEGFVVKMWRRIIFESLKIKYSIA